MESTWIKSIFEFHPKSKTQQRIVASYGWVGWCLSNVGYHEHGTDKKDSTRHEKTARKKVKHLHWRYWCEIEKRLDEIESAGKIVINMCVDCL